MFNNSRILIVLILIALSLSSYVLFSLNRINIQEQDAVDVDLKISSLNIEGNSSANYSDRMELLLGEIDSSIRDSENISENRINNFKNEILALKSPDNDYKDIHLNLVLALDSLKNYLDQGDLKDYEKSINLLEIAKLKYFKIDKQKENDY